MASGSWCQFYSKIVPACDLVFLRCKKVDCCQITSCLEVATFFTKTDLEHSCILFSLLSGQKVRMYFTNFILEVATTYNRCSFDYVIIYDGDSNADAEFGKFCGTNTPPTVVSSGRHLFVHFHTDGSVEETGFRAEVHSVDSDYIGRYSLSLV